jgi:PAS domain S-box-containing protein
MGDPNQTPAVREPRGRAAAAIGAFGIVYLGLCLAGDQLSNAGSEFSTFWPASGLFVGALLVSRRSRWGMIAAAAVVAESLVSAYVGRRLPMLAGNAAVDVLEAVSVALLVQRASGGRPGRSPVRETLAVLFLGAVTVPIASGFLGAGVAWLTLPGADFFRIWREWWVGDALGVLVVAPLVLSWAAPRSAREARWRLAEAGVVAAALAGSAWAVFGGGLHLERTYLLLPALVYAAVRFGTRGASTAAAIVSLVCAWSTAQGAPHAAGAPEMVVQVQLLIAVAVATTLLLAAALEERERARAALRASEARFDAFLRHSPAAIFVRDAAGALVVANERARALLGPGAEPTGGTAAEADAADDARVLAGGAPVQRRVRLGDREVLLAKFLVPSGSGPSVGGVALDVTEQRQAERALRLAQTALERGFAATLFLDLEGRIGYANEAAQRLFARSAAELVGHAVWEVAHGLPRDGWRARWEELRARGSLVVAGAVVRPAGERIEVELGASHLAFDGTEYGILVARDLTDRRRAEQAQRLASLGTLAAGMAHEINNPLTYVATNVGFAADAIRPLAAAADVSEALRALDDAAEGARRVGKVVRDLLSVARVDPSARRRVDPAEEVRAALNLAQNELRHRARLVTRFDPVPAVRAGEFEVGQVVVNLLVNAAHAIPEGASDRNEIRVSTRTAADGAAVVEVQDTGQGIAAEHLGRIFEPFFSTKALGKGSGLGLTVCHGIVAALDGRIEVESTPGRGATFRVVLPADAGKEPARADEERERAAPAARILVVDDEPLIGKTVRRVLSGHDVVALTDAHEALERIRRGERFDLVLCDLMMPEMTGMDLHSALAREAPDLARRMIFITGGAFTDGAREFLERTGIPHLAKPFAPAGLRDVVGAALAAERQDGLGRTRESGVGR